MAACPGSSPGWASLLHVLEAGRHDAGRHPLQGHTFVLDGHAPTLCLCKPHCKCQSRQATTKLPATPSMAKRSDMLSHSSSSHAMTVTPIPSSPYQNTAPRHTLNADFTGVFAMPAYFTIMLKHISGCRPDACATAAGPGKRHAQVQQKGGHHCPFNSAGKLCVLPIR